MEKETFHSFLVRDSKNKSFSYFNANSDHFSGSQIQISENFNKEVTEYEFLPPSESCSHVKRVYFIVPSEDCNLTDNKIKNNPPSLNLFDNDTQQSSEVIFKNSLENDFTNEPCSLSLEIFETKTDSMILSSDKFINNCLDKNLGQHYLTFADKLSQRNLLLPKKSQGNHNGKINCDKSNLVLQSESLNSESIMKSENNQFLFCAQCEIKFNSLDDLQMHKLEEHGEINLFPSPHSSRSKHFGKQFTCELCGKEFLRLYDLKLHLNIHLELKSYICHLCGRQFAHSSNLYRHIRIHTKVNPYPCKFCDKRFSQVSSLFTHLITHTNGGLCPDCGAEYHSVSGLRNHARSIHEKLLTNDDIKKIFFNDPAIRTTRSFHCKVCSANFHFKKDLKMHENNLHSGKCIPCKNCSKIFLTLNDFKSHPCIKCKKMKGSNREPDKSNSFLCTNCDQICDSYKSSENHLCVPDTKSSENLSNEHDITVTILEKTAPEETFVINVNEEDSSYSSDFKKDNSFFCESPININIEEILENNEKNLIVDVKRLDAEVIGEFEDGNRYKAEMKKLNTTNIGKFLDTKKTNFKCKYCDKVFTKKWNWSQHIGTHNLALRQYQCEHCPKTFSYRSTYARHIRCHSVDEDEVFPCPNCSKSFKTKVILQKHMNRIHEKIKNFRCKLCSKGFFGKSDYNYHLRLHKGELPYVCCFCGKKFSHTSQLLRHERMHSGERPHKCPYCPKGFIQAVTLRKHLQKHECVVNKEAENATCIPPPVINTDIRNSEKDYGIINFFGNIEMIWMQNKNSITDF